MKLILALVVTFLGTSAFALDESLCPQSFTLNLSRVSAYKSSIYSDVAGWKEVNAKLAADTADRSWTFEASDEKSGCFYKAATGETALVVSNEVKDETGFSYEVTYLSVYFKIAGEKMSVFPEVTFDNGFQIYKTTKTERTRIKTPLDSNGKIYNFEIGLAELSLN